MLCFIMQSVHCMLLQSSGDSRSLRSQSLMIQVTGVGSGTLEQSCGYHIGPICQMPAVVVHFYYTVPAQLLAKATVSVIEREFAAVHCASVRAAAQIMLLKLKSILHVLYVLLRVNNLYNLV